eukprot:gnl/TRDRNA2_/TRDRNA2_164278_c0_seq1.p1 gnl/TRDRNA2_/TRDRNA2_164278_c0~~gnl/TRDRNA2_/TRDRNA2_164278_c0_seq1.p1  ORF type:complete len:128 (-),score=9.05 gnl/TRDRNA2_/TRDRNA2_164278_c0_seq1:140-523(-)
MVTVLSGCSLAAGALRGVGAAVHGRATRLARAVPFRLVAGVACIPMIFAVPRSLLSVAAHYVPRGRSELSAKASAITSEPTSGGESKQRADSAELKLVAAALGRQDGSSIAESFGDIMAWAEGDASE